MTSEVPIGAKLPDLDVAFGAFTYTDDVDFDHLGGGLKMAEFDLISLLCKPITVAGDVLLAPAFQYGYNDLDFSGVGGAFPLRDDELQSFSLHLAAIKLNEGSPWFYGGWARVELASDFEHVTSDAFTLDLAAGVGYRFNEQLMVAAGAAFLNFNGDFWICPGINFDWEVNDQLRIGLYGPIPVISYTPSEDWSFSLRGYPGGGIWNIEDNTGASKAIDLTSYQIGAFVGRRLTGQLWLNAGVGFTTFNNITLSDPDGNYKTLDEDMDWGLFGQIGLSLKIW
ncbi:MAG: DUF6268 family outer membrane beta-barrel protein [Akkermansiaceae bacterium]|nr:DUF6268 family outer membrane beta-barrel protein [Akkermansiaceae bacterium]MCF7734521.1 DUF6268 family outer membrane beta-barrel protein [Akkermansiaceae bacterium]